MSEKAIYGILNAVTEITDLVSGIFPVVATQDSSFPYIIYQKVTTIPTDIKSAGSPLDRARYQVDIYSKSKSQAITIAGHVRTALDRYSGTIAGIKVDSVRFVDEQDGPFEEELRVYRLIQEYE